MTEKALPPGALQLTSMEIVVEVEHLPVVLRLPSPLERLDDLEERFETLSHGQVTPKILRLQKSPAAELLRLPEVGLDQSPRRVRSLYNSAPFLR